MRGFLAGGGPAAFFDLPWMPLYLFLAFAFHFWIGVTALLRRCLLLISLTILTEVFTRKAARETVGAGAMRNSALRSWSPQCRISFMRWEWPHP